mgnify:CR=1 FL=1
MRTIDPADTEVNISVIILCCIIILCGFYVLIKTSRIFWHFIYLLDRPRRRPTIPATTIEITTVEKNYVIIIHPDDKVQLGISV